jgi:uncharacterized protein YggT (Ycf19 family)
VPDESPVAAWIGFASIAGRRGNGWLSRFIIRGMQLIDQILDLAGLLLWLNWRSIRFIPAENSVNLSLLSTLQRAEPRATARWPFLAGLLGLLAVRSVVYWRIGPDLNWTAALDLVAIRLPFRSDRFHLMFLYSVVSFSFILASFYSWLLLISAVNRKVTDTDPVQKLVRLHLGWFERCPASLKLCLPMIISILLWSLLTPVLTRLGICPVPISNPHRWQQALVLGAGSLLVWQFLLLGILLLHLLNSYVYLGYPTFFHFVNTTARNLLRPIGWLPLRISKLDFSPILGIALILVANELGCFWLPRLFQRLPL